MTEQEKESKRSELRQQLDQAAARGDREAVKRILAEIQKINAA